jgi:small-conductance mechanosensitive channel
MQDGSSIAVNKGFKETKLTSYKDSSMGLKKEGISFRQLIIKFADIGVTIFLVAILISAFWQPLFRDLLLDWLKYILENN